MAWHGKVRQGMTRKVVGMYVVGMHVPFLGVELYSMLLLFLHACSIVK
jgi:hypothetical protein